MHILESTWLIQMLEKSSKKPIERILNLFDILEDWSNAPGVQVQIPGREKIASPAEPLLTFIANEAIKIKCEAPSALAYQIIFMAIAAVDHAFIEPKQPTFKQAKIAAYALITAQLSAPIWSRISTKYYAVAALILTMFAGLMFFEYTKHGPAIQQQFSDNSSKFMLLSNDAKEQAISPMQVAVLFSSIEAMRKGSCQFPEAIQIPDQHKSAYIDIVFNGKAPSSLQELAIANHYLSMVRCNYTPMLMSNSRN